MFKLILIMYTLVSNAEAIKLIKQNNGRVIMEIETNEASVVKLIDNRFLIIPNRGDSSMLFENEEDYNSFISDPVFPKTNKIIFFNYENQLYTINKTIEPFYDTLNKLLRNKIEVLRSDSGVYNLFDLVNKKLKENQIPKDTLIVPIGIVIGDYLCKKYGFFWETHKEFYNFQSYYNPRLFYKVSIGQVNKIAFDDLWSLIITYYRENFFDFNDFNQEVQLFIDTIELNTEDVE